MKDNSSMKKFVFPLFLIGLIIVSDYRTAVEAKSLIPTTYFECLWECLRNNPGCGSDSYSELNCTYGVPANGNQQAFHECEQWGGGHRYDGGCAS